MSALRVGVMYGGRSGEHEVSLMSARSILGALRSSHYEVVEIGITLEGKWLVGDDVMRTLRAARSPGNARGDAGRAGALRGFGQITEDTAEEELHLRLFREVDVIFPVLHGTFGEDGTLQGFLELAEVAYVGAGVLASSVAMDKALFKHLMRAHGVPVVEYILCGRGEIAHDLDGVVRRAEAMAPYPLFAKPANLGSSVGITRCANRSDLVEGLAEAARYDRRVLVERGVDAREIEVSVLGNETPQASVPGEVHPEPGFLLVRIEIRRRHLAARHPGRYSGRNGRPGSAPGGGSLPGDRRGGAVARRFSARPEIGRAVSERTQHDAGLHQHQHVPETLGSQRAGVSATDRPADRAGHGAACGPDEKRTQLPEKLG